MKRPALAIAILAALPLLPPPTTRPPSSARAGCNSCGTTRSRSSPRISTSRRPRCGSPTASATRTDAPVTYIVAFPLPVIDAIVPEAMNIMLPDAASENFVGFTVTVDGKPVTPMVEARVTALGIDRTDVVRGFGLPLNPIAEGPLPDARSQAPEPEKQELNQLGLDLYRPLQRRGGVEAGDDLLLGTDLPAGRGARRRAQLPAGHGLRLLRRLGVQASRPTSRNTASTRPSRRRRGRSSRPSPTPTCPTSTSGG